MTVEEIRKRYIAFFKKRGHRVISSASLVPENDGTTLFVGSGMQPLLPYLLGAKHAEGSMLVNAQKCFRAEDIEEIGDNRHTTFFEMLGNWSLGEYFKQQQLAWFFEFLTNTTDGARLLPSRLFVTVFAGDRERGLNRDEESAEIWRELFKQKGIEAKEKELIDEEQGARLGMNLGQDQDGKLMVARIFYYGAKKNWWSRSGVPENMPVGEPGGSDSEVFYDFDPSGKMHDIQYGAQCHPNCDCGRFMEIGNSVFMQYVKNKDGGFDELPQMNVDFGGGLERIATASNNNPDIFDIDIFENMKQILEKKSGYSYKKESAKIRQSFRIIMDHVRASIFLISDGVTAGKTDQNYFVRRLLRRAFYHADKITARDVDTMRALVHAVVHVYSECYPALKDKIEYIAQIIIDEDMKFRNTYERGRRQFDKLSYSDISGSGAFDLYQTYGLPIDMTLELAEEKGIKVDQKGFDMELQKHQNISRKGVAQKFKGGLLDHSLISIKYHTATHLLHQALRDVLGQSVYQKGSNITPDRLRFDFSFDRKMTDQEKTKVEHIVNQKITAHLPVCFEILSIEEAKARGAIGLFDDQYGEKVKVYKIGESADKLGATRESGLYSLEFCGGPHVENTRVLGEGDKHFKIIKEEAISAGSRRIRAVLE